MGGAGLAIIAVIALVVCAVLLWRAQKPRQAAVRLVSYRCVGIQPADSENACEVVRAIAGKRFLPGHSPKLPLPACTVERCSCKYVHFDDRRAGNRREEGGVKVRKLQSMDWDERRRNRGRRKTDRPGMLDEAQMQAAIAEKRRRRGR